MKRFIDEIATAEKTVQSELEKTVRAFPKPVSEIGLCYLGSEMLGSGGEVTRQELCTCFSGLTYMLCVSVYDRAANQNHGSIATAFGLLSIVDRLRQPRFIDQCGHPILFPGHISASHLRVAGNMMQASALSKVLELQDFGYSPGDVQTVVHSLSTTYLHMISDRLTAASPEGAANTVDESANVTGLATEVSALLFHDSENAKPLKRFGLGLGTATRLIEESRCFRILSQDPSLVNERNAKSFAAMVPTRHALRLLSVDPQSAVEQEDEGQIAHIVRGMLADATDVSLAVGHTWSAVEARLKESSEVLDRLSGSTGAELRVVLRALVKYVREKGAEE